MSIVFLADEEQPRRSVAIKVLNPEVTAHLGRERFLREVDLLSNLNHPHIVPIFAAGEADSLLYYVMPYQSGQTLRDVLGSEGPLRVEFALAIAREVADALEYAHRREVVHRDVKPENILISGDHAIVADFGIARAIAAAGDATITQTGVAVGTPAYMSPEQVADEDVDGRADIYSLGCVVYEMLTGETPYAGRSSRALIARHALDPIPSLRRHRPLLSLELDEAVRRALEKSPADRYSRAGEFGLALETAATRERAAVTLSTGGVLPRSRLRWLVPGAVLTAGALAAWLTIHGRSASDAMRPSLAVLPLRNLTDGDLASTVAGFGQEITGRLAQDSGLTVKAHSSVLALLDAGTRSVRAIAESLDVDYLVDGFFSGVNDNIRIAAELIDPASGRVLWSDQFEGGPEEAHGFENDVALAVMGTLSPDQVVASRGLEGIHSPGQELYVRGVQEASRRTRTAMVSAETAFREAIERDSTLAPAYAGLASVYGLSLHYRYDLGLPAYEAAGRGLALADRAIELDPDLPDAYSARALIASTSLAPTEIVGADFEQALKLAPSSPSAAAWFGSLLMREKRFDEALENSLRAVDLDPRVPSRRLSVALQALQLRRYDLAVEHARVADAFAPALLRARELQAMGLLLAGRADECLAVDLGPHQALRAACLDAAGRRDEAAAVVKQVADNFERGDFGETGHSPALFARDLAIFHAWVGDVEAARRWTEEAFELSPLGVDGRILDSGLFDRVLDEPSFQAALNRLRNQVWNRVNGERRRIAATLGS